MHGRFPFSPVYQSATKKRCTLDSRHTTLKAFPSSQSLPTKHRGISIRMFLKFVGYAKKKKKRTLLDQCVIKLYTPFSPGKSFTKIKAWPDFKISAWLCKCLAWRQRLHIEIYTRTKIHPAKAQQNSIQSVYATNSTIIKKTNPPIYNTCDHITSSVHIWPADFIITAFTPQTFGRSKAPTIKALHCRYHNTLLGFFSCNTALNLSMPAFQPMLHLAWFARKVPVGVNPSLHCILGTPAAPIWLIARLLAVATLSRDKTLFSTTAIRNTRQKSSRSHNDVRRQLLLPTSEKN